MKVTKVIVAAIIIMICPGCRSSGVSSPAPRIPVNPEDIKKNVVSITAKFRDRNDPELGFGFVTGQKGDILYIVTANHLVRTNTPVTDASQITVRFFKGQGSPVVARLMEEYDSVYDVALLEVEKPGKYDWAANVFYEKRHMNETALFIGKNSEWFIPSGNETGQIKDVADFRLNIRINSIEPGTSGAPLITRNGIVGMIVEDTGSSQNTAKAIQIKHIKYLMQDWGYCFNCMEPPPPSPHQTCFHMQPHCKENAFVNELGMAFVLIRHGEFMMGTPDSEKGRDKDEIKHRVVLTNDFYMQETEVTQCQWETVMDKLPWSETHCGENCPVTNVSWEEVNEFIQRLNSTSENTYRLPAEAEWEYACRAGSSAAYSWGDNPGCENARYSVEKARMRPCNRLMQQEFLIPSSYEGPLMVMTYAPNPWCLYDMHGNAGEWCSDFYAPYKAGTSYDPKGPEDGEYRVVRGGGYISDAKYCRSGSRTRSAPDQESPHIGFRLAMDVKGFR